MTADAAAVPSRSERLLRAAERRLPALTRLRQTEPLPIRLHRRRIYVLPTRYGLAFGVMLFVMLMAALNYGNNPALLLTSLLGAALLSSMFRAVRNLDQVELHSIQATPVHAGDTLGLTLHFSAPAHDHYGLSLGGSFGEMAFELHVHTETRITLELPTAQRGWIATGRLQLATDYPFGLFRPWSYLHPQVRFVVYPRLEARAPGFPLAARADGQRALRGADDEFANLRDYRQADAQRLIAWKASARHDRLLVRELECRQGPELEFDWAQLPELDDEARISRLATWVTQAASAGQRYALILPRQRLGPDSGDSHRHACLHALALLPGAQP